LQISQAQTVDTISEVRIDAERQCLEAACFKQRSILAIQHRNAQPRFTEAFLQQGKGIGQIQTLVFQAQALTAYCWSDEWIQRGHKLLLCRVVSTVEKYQLFAQGQWIVGAHRHRAEKVADVRTLGEISADTLPQIV